MDSDESDERGNCVRQSSDAEPVEMRHCRRVGFVALRRLTHVVSEVNAAVPACGAREAALMTRRDGGDRKTGDTRDSRSRVVHATVALASTNTDRLFEASQLDGRRTSGGLTAFQATMALERQRYRPLTPAAVRRL